MFLSAKEIWLYIKKNISSYFKIFGNGFSTHTHTHGHTDTHGHMGTHRIKKINSVWFCFSIALFLFLGLNLWTIFGHKF